LASDRIDCKNLKSVELINGEAGKYLPLTFRQNSDGLIVSLPERPFDELAYVLKLSFNGKIPPLNNFAILNTNLNYYIIPGENTGGIVLGSDLSLTGNRKFNSNKWNLESEGKGFYKILNCENTEKVLECNVSNHELDIANDSGKNNQSWKIEEAHNGLYKISNKQFSNLIMSIKSPFIEGNKAELINAEKGSKFYWNLFESCGMKQQAYKPHSIPGIVEAEDFDTGCPGEAYYSLAGINEGGQYRPNEGIGIEKCSAGGYNVGWTHTGEWMAYTVTVKKTAEYQISFYIASNYDSGKLHLESDGVDKTGIISIPNTEGFQIWEVINKKIKLDAGQHVLKLVVDGDYFNLDKMVFDDIK
jgi:hypothetical protein